MKLLWQNLSWWEIGVFAVGCALLVYGLNLLTIQRLAILIGVFCIVITLHAALSSQGTKERERWPLFVDHEEGSKKRYCDAQLSLLNMQDDLGLKFLSDKLDVQLKLEDFLVRFRESEHAKVKVWGTIFTAGIVSLIVALLARIH